MCLATSIPPLCPLATSGHGSPHTLSAALMYLCQASCVETDMTLEKVVEESYCFPRFLSHRSGSPSLSSGQPCFHELTSHNSMPGQLIPHPTDIHTDWGSASGSLFIEFSFVKAGISKLPCKGPESEYFRSCSLFGLCCNCSILH